MRLRRERKQYKIFFNCFTCAAWVPAMISEPETSGPPCPAAAHSPLAAATCCERIQKRPKYNSSIRLRKHMQWMVSKNLSAYGNKIYISARHMVAKLRNHNIFSRGLWGFLLFFCICNSLNRVFLKPGQKFFKLQFMRVHILPDEKCLSKNIKFYCFVLHATSFNDCMRASLMRILEISASIAEIRKPSEQKVISSSWAIEQFNKFIWKAILVGAHLRTDHSLPSILVKLKYCATILVPDFNFIGQAILPCLSDRAARRPFSQLFCHFCNA